MNHTRKHGCRIRLAIHNLGTLFLEYPEVAERPDVIIEFIDMRPRTDMWPRTLRKETIIMGLEIMGLDG
jgi:hypothetical protein